MIIQESAQMYLETIYVLQQRNGFVRSVDIANEMGYSKPTISEWMGKLRENGYLTIGDGGNVTLTEKGELIARDTYERHVVLSDLFESIGVSPETAHNDACRVEHYISEETFKALRSHYESLVGPDKDIER